METLQPTEDERPEVELMSIDAEDGRARERMVVVVPPLAEGHERDHPIVSTLVARSVGAPPEAVTDRVHAPGRVVKEKYAHEPAPHEGFQRSSHGLRNGEPGQERESECHRDPERIHAVDRADGAVGQQVTCIAIVVRTTLRREEPADVRVPQASEPAGKSAVAPDMR